MPHFQGKKSKMKIMKQLPDDVKFGSELQHKIDIEYKKSKVIHEKDVFDKKSYKKPTKGKGKERNMPAKEINKGTNVSQ